MVNYFFIFYQITFYPTQLYLGYLIIHFWRMLNKYIDTLAPELDLKPKKYRIVLCIFCIPTLASIILTTILITYKIFHIINSDDCSALFQTLYKVDWYLHCVLVHFNGLLILICIDFMAGGNKPPPIEDVNIMLS